MDSKLHAAESGVMMRNKRFDLVFFGGLFVILVAYLVLMLFLAWMFADYKPIKPNYSDIRLYTNQDFKAQVVQQRHFQRAAKLNQVTIQQWIIRHNARKP